MSLVSLHQHISALTLVVVFGCVGLALVQRSRCLVVIVGLVVLIWFGVGFVWSRLWVWLCWFGLGLAVLCCGCGFCCVAWVRRWLCLDAVVGLVVFGLFGSTFTLLGCDRGFGCVGFVQR